MSAPNTLHSSAAVRYDTCLQRAKLWRLPPGHAAPQPTSAWPAENVALLEHYREWLVSGGPAERHQHALRADGRPRLGLALRPHSALNTEPTSTPR
jgi:hypothetical protein